MYFKVTKLELKYNVKKTCLFYLNLVRILSILILCVKNRGKGVLLLNGHNPLSVTKVISWQSLTFCGISFDFFCFVFLVLAGF